MAPEHPVLAGSIAGICEISVTFPFEYVKTQLQLQQQASGLYAGEKAYAGSIDCAIRTVRQHGLLGLYRGGMSWAVFAGPRSGVRFGAFEALSGASREHELPSFWGQAAVDATNGLLAGVCEAALCQTPNQVIAIKMIHDMSPRGPKQYRGFAHCVASIWREEGVAGFYKGLTPAVAKGATTNAIRFLGYGRLKELMRGGDDAPLSPLQSMLAGGTAGAVSALATQPIDTVKANMMGLDAGRYRSSIHCAVALARAGGVMTLFNGATPRVIRGALTFVTDRGARQPACPHHINRR